VEFAVGYGYATASICVNGIGAAPADTCVSAATLGTVSRHYAAGDINDAAFGDTNPRPGISPGIK
jgi:hypothetical protein